MKMKQLLLMLAIVTLTFEATVAQRQFVIGSKVPSMKDIEWIDIAPQSTNIPMLIEFYQSSNPTSVKLLDKLPDLQQSYGSTIAFVVLTGDSRSVAESLSGRGYFVGYDPQGEVFKNFGVRFTPFTMIVDSKGLLHWQGNLSNITTKALETVK